MGFFGDFFGFGDKHPETTALSTFIIQTQQEAEMKRMFEQAYAATHVQQQYQAQGYNPGWGTPVQQRPYPGQPPRTICKNGMWYAIPNANLLYTGYGTYENGIYYEMIPAPVVAHQQPPYGQQSAYYGQPQLPAGHGQQQGQLSEAQLQQMATRSFSEATKFLGANAGKLKDFVTNLLGGKTQTTQNNNDRIASIKAAFEGKW